MKKKKIAFIELETHSALLEQWYFLLAAMESVDFHFFVSQKVLDKLSAIPSHHLTLIADATEIDAFSSGYDAFLVNTLHRDFKDFEKLLALKPALVLVHNLNFSLFFQSVSWKNIWTEKQWLVYFLKLYFREKVGQNRKVIGNASHYGVLSQSLFETIQEKGKAIAGKTKVLQLNYNKESRFEALDEIRIVMPGNVSGKRKDIRLLFGLLPKLDPKSRLHIIFLGKPESKHVLHRIEQLKKTCSEKIILTHFPGFIPWEEYSTVISKAHLLLCPIKIKTSFYWVTEWYGQTKVSGSETDCIYNGKIGVFPSAYPKMDWHNLYYDNEKELAGILNGLDLENLEKEYGKLQPYLEKYTFQSVKEQVENQLLQLANT
ncbi:glycosyltransferase family protein [Flavobacterium humi]|uniref:Glycosyltransferase family 1 protein n=1 Tax=Flavobacterium humi TaxID=2562683 RepID=A0A4Z0L5N1_9FLAO|nr:hypothetical protein [Flavobacterium humi]TGD57010.1 hypothetical protein E4635_12620 [Flavobacterium humi]